MSYEIQHFTLCDGWVNTWTVTHDDGKEEMEIFETYEDAKSALTEFLEEEDMAYFNGDIDSRYHADEFRIVEVAYEIN